MRASSARGQAVHELVSDRQLHTSRYKKRHTSVSLIRHGDGFEKSCKSKGSLPLH